MPKKIILPGDWKLDEQEREIALNEAAGWELQTLKRQPGSNDNVARFKRLPIGDRPNRIRLVLTTEPPPQNAVKLFECVLLLAGEEAQVSTYRDLHPQGP